MPYMVFQVHITFYLIPIAFRLLMLVFVSKGKTSAENYTLCIAYSRPYTVRALVAKVAHCYPDFELAYMANIDCSTTSTKNVFLETIEKFL